MSPVEIKEDLQYIRQIIENNQRALIDNGVMFITNGICVLFGLALTVLVGSPGRDAFIPAIWVILVIIMVVLNHKLPQRIDPNLPKKHSLLSSCRPILQPQAFLW